MIIDRKIATVRSAKANRKTPDKDVKKKDIDAKLTEETVYMYGDIGGYFGIDHLEFVKDFNEITADVVHLRIDSQGGDVFAARAMKTAIMQHPAKVIAHIDGIAASAASFMAMGADEIEMVDGGFLMIHNAMSFMDVFGYFNILDLENLQETIEREVTLHGKINKSIANDYVKRSGKDLDEVLAWMSDETWFTAEEALENEFIDRVYDGDPIEASYDLSIFNKAPESLLSRNQEMSKRILENALRDVGLNQVQAKAVLAVGYKESQRDADSVIEDPPAISSDQRDADPDDVPKDKVAQLLNPKEDTDKATDLLERAESMFPSAV